MGVSSSVDNGRLVQGLNVSPVDPGGKFCQNCELMYYMLLFQTSVLMCAGFLFAWMPYAVVSLISAYGNPRNIPIEATVVPVMLAKSSTMCNPIIYFFYHPRHRKAVRESLGLKSEEVAQTKSEKPTQIQRSSIKQKQTSNTLVSAQVSVNSDTKLLRVNSIEIREWISEMKIYTDRAREATDSFDSKDTTADSLLGSSAETAKMDSLCHNEI